MSIVAIVIVATWLNVAVLLTDTYVLSSGVVIEHFSFWTSRFCQFCYYFYDCLWAGTFGNIASNDKKLYPDCGPKYAIVPLCLTAILPLIFYFIAYYVVPSELNIRTLFNMTVYMVVYMILFIIWMSLSCKWHRMNTKSLTWKADEMNNKEEWLGAMALAVVTFGRQSLA